MALVHLSYSEFKDIYGDLGLTYWAKYNWLSEANWYSLEVLPKDYEKVAYIESTGEQYIDSGVIGSQKTIISAKVYSPNSVYQAIFGGRLAYGSRQIAVFYGQVNYRFDYGFLNSEFNGFAHTEPIEVKQDKNKLYADNRFIGSLQEATFTTPVSIYLFAINNNGSPIGSFAGKFYQCKIYEDDELIRYFVPCVRKSDNEAGLYDLVNNEFYANDGSGDFVIPS